MWTRLPNAAAVLAAGVTTTLGTSPVRLGAQAPVVIERVTVVDVERGSLRRDASVLVADGRIARIAPAGAIPTPARGRSVDARGAYLVPGLIDTHVHYVAPHVYGPLLVAAGVTTVRDMGAPAGVLAEATARHGRGDDAGPDVVVATMIDGDPPIHPFALAAGTPEAARRAVRRAAADGARQVKVYSTLRRDAYDAVVEEARRLGLPVVGHVPFKVPLEATLGSQREVHHLAGVAEALAGGAKARTPFEQAFGPWSALDAVSVRERDRLLRRIAASRQAHVPTLAMFEAVAATGDATHLPDSVRALVPADVRAVWGAIKYGAVATEAPRHLPRLAAMVRAMHAAGVPILAGSDLTNHGTVAGRSLHRELDLLAAAGLSPLEVLRSATSRAAAALGVAGQAGSVSVGKAASLLLLDGNPLTSVENLHRVRAVVLRGTYLDRAALDSLERSARAIASGERDVAETDEPPLPGRVEAEGRFVMRAGENVLGEERFALAVSDSGSVLRSVTRTGAGGPPGATTTYVLDSDRRLRYAVREEGGADGRRTVYRVTGDSVRVESRGRRGDSTFESHALPAGGLVVGADLSAELLLASRLPDGAADTLTLEVLRFGEESWRLRRSQTRVVPRARMDSSGDAARSYELTYDSPWGQMRSATWVDRRQLVVRAETIFPVGNLRITAAREDAAAPAPRGRR